MNDNAAIFSLSTYSYLDGIAEGHVALREGFIVSRQPEMPYTEKIITLVEELKDLVKAVTHPPASQIVIPEDSETGGEMRRSKKRLSATSASSSGIAPRLIRLRDAPQYLGMDPNRFNAEVRPYLTEIPIGIQGVAFDKVDLDAWAEQYKQRNGRPGKATKGGQPWDAREHRGSSKEAKRGTSRRQSQVRELEKALERVTSRKRRDT